MAALAFVLAAAGCGLRPAPESPDGGAATGDSAGQTDDSAAQAEEGQADEASGTADEASGAADESADRGPGTQAMRRLLQRQGAADEATGAVDRDAMAALRARVATLEDAVQGLEARVGAMEPAVQRWTDMEGRLEQVVASLRENADQRQQIAAPVPAPPPASLAARDPTEPPPDPALRDSRRGRGESGNGDDSMPAADTGSTGAPDEIDTPGLHLVSYENRDNAGPGWQNLKERYSEPLSGLERRMATVTLPDGRTFHRLVAGPVESIEAAQQRCQALEEQGQYCAVTDFVGTPG